MSVLPRVARCESGRCGGGGGGGFTPTVFMVAGSALIDGYKQQGMEKIRSAVLRRTSIQACRYLFRGENDKVSNKRYV